MVDRILQAISPALSFEVERIIEETRQNVENQFADRLQAAENERREAVERAITQTREAALNEVTADVTGTLQAQFTQTLAAREDEHKKAAAEWDLERDRMKQEIERLRVFVEAQNQLSDASSQPEILIRWLRLAEPFARSVAVYTTRGDGLALWKSRGDAVFPGVISAQITDPESYFKPIMVRDKAVAAVCALPPYQGEILNFLVATMERAILIFGMRLRTPLGTPATLESARTIQKF
jgi:hypothetical protein